MTMYWYNAVNNLYQQDKKKFLKLVELKGQIIKDVMEFNKEKDNCKSALILGFNPILWYVCKEIEGFQYYALCTDDHESEFIRSHEDLQNIKVLTKEEATGQKFDIVMALDSYFTRFGSEAEQKEMIAEAHGYTGKTLITTI